MKNKISFFGSSTPPCLKRKIIGAARLTCKIMRLNGVSVDIYILSDNQMKKIKSRYLPLKKGPANTLSFSGDSRFILPENKHKHLGEIFINQQSIRGRSQSALTLFVHSFLHLLGYHHDTKRAIMARERVENKLFRVFIKPE